MKVTSLKLYVLIPPSGSAIPYKQTARKCKKMQPENLKLSKRNRKIQAILGMIRENFQQPAGQPARTNNTLCRCPADERCMQ
jgi:hypothetical protein